MDKKHLTLTILMFTALLAPSASLAQPAAPPAAHGGAPPNPQPRVVEVSSHIGGQTHDVFVQDNLAYVGEGTTLTILDVTDPAAPVVVGRTEPRLGLVKSVVVAEGVAYIARGQGGLDLVDVIDPRRPEQLSSFQISAEDVAVNGSTVYVVDDETLTIIDAADPTQPALLGSMETGLRAEAVAVESATVFIGGRWHGLLVVDVTDPAHPIPVALIPSNGGDFTDLVVAGTTLYVADSFHGLLVVDVAHPSQPSVLATLALEQYAQAIAIAGQTLWIGGYGGLVAIDVTDPSHPAQIGDVTMLARPIAMVVAGAVAYIAGYDAQGVHIVDVSDPANPAELTFYGTSYTAISLALSRQSPPSGAATIGCLADGNGGLRILDLSDPAKPRGFSYHQAGGYKQAVVAGSIAYIAGGGGLIILDLADPANPVQLGFVRTQGFSYGVAVQGAIAYVAADVWGGLRVIDVSDPLLPVEIGHYDTPGQAAGVVVKGSIAYVADGSQGLRLIDVSDPTQPVEVGYWDTPRSALAVAVVGRIAYVADGRGGLRIIDVGDPAHPRELAALPTDGYAQGLSVAGNIVYVAVQYPGIQIVDVSDPAHPVEIGQYDTPWDARGVTVSGSYAYVADGEGGVLILSLLQDKVVATISPSGGSLTSTGGDTALLFPAGSFAQTVQLTYRRLLSDQAAGRLLGIGHTFEVSAVDASTGEPADLNLGQSFAAVIRYAAAEIGSIVKESLALYYWDGTQWVREPSSVVHLHNNTITATPDHLGLFAVLGETYRSYLPIMAR